jgi:hypothetical protein
MRIHERVKLPRRVRPDALGFKPASSGSFEVESACLEHEAAAVAALDERRSSIVKALQRSWLFATLLESRTLAT